MEIVSEGTNELPKSEPFLLGGHLRAVQVALDPDGDVLVWMLLHFHTIFFSLGVTCLRSGT